LGVTPSAWSGGGVARAIQIGSYGAGLFSNAGGDTLSTLTHGAYFDGTNWKYLATSVGAGRYQITGADAGSVHSWSTSAGGTAGNNITFTQAMTLNASGQLAVGTTSPEGVLHINKAASATLGGQLVIDNSNGSAVGNAVEISFLTDGGASGTGTRNSRIRVVNENTGNGAANMQFWTFSGVTDAERARITPGGVIIFGGTGSTAADANKCFVDPNASAEGGRYTAVGNNSGGGALFLGARSDTGANTILIRPDGDVENANNSYGSISDERLKQDIVDASSQWDDIKSLRVRKYRFKSEPDAPLQIGVIAQELEMVSPGLVSSENDDLNYGHIEGPVKTVKYSVLYMKAIKALQEAMTRIEQLEAKVAALEGV
jgi:hypothetical protein